MTELRRSPTDALDAIDDIINRLVTFMSDGSSLTDADSLLQIQADVDRVLSALWGKAFRVDTHGVRLWPISMIDSRIALRSLPPEMLAESLLHCVARLRQIKINYESTPSPAPVAPAEPDRAGVDGNVFLIHGHDRTRRDLISGFLATVGLRPIVCMETAAAGLTIIERIEEAGAVSFAIALLTPDDVGRAADTPGSETARGRQNVIFEIGYFSGRLGRARVCVLRAGHLEVPTDLHGLVFIEMDSRERWKIELVRELRAAGLPLNLDLWI